MNSSRLIVAITFIGIFAMATRVSADTDTWWHLRAGQWIVEHRAVPVADPFSHTRAGAEWKYPGWIIQAPMYWLYTAFGYAGLNLFTAFFVTLTFVFVFLSCEGPPLLRAFTLVLAAAASAIYWSARPQIVSFALAGAFAYVLDLHRWHRVNRLWLLVPLMGLWANAHGGFAIGFILIAITLAGQALALAMRSVGGRLRGGLAGPEPLYPGDVDGRGVLWLAGTGLACAAAVMLNPAGPAMLLYPFKTVSIGVLQEFIQEWQSPNFHQREAQAFLWLLFVTLAMVGFSGRRMNLSDLLLVTGTAYLGFLAGRNIALFAVVAPPVITRHAAAAWAALRARLPPELVSEKAMPAQRTTVINWTLLAVIGLAAVVKIAVPLLPATNEAQMARILPVGAADYVRRMHPPGPMFNSYNFGGYLAWALYPDYPVFVDGRTDLYDDEFLREYLNVAFGRPSYQATLDKYSVHLVIVEADSLLADQLRRAPGWRSVHADALAEVFVRR